MKKHLKGFALFGLPGSGKSTLMDISWSLLKYLWHFDAEKGAYIEELKKKYPHADFREIKSSRDAMQFLKECENASV